MRDAQFWRFNAITISARASAHETFSRARVHGLEADVAFLPLRVVRAGPRLGGRRRSRLLGRRRPDVLGVPYGPARKCLTSRAPASRSILAGDDQTSADVVAGGLAGGAMTNAFLAVLEKKDDGDLQYHELMDALHRELSRKRMSQKPQLSSSQKFELDDRAFSLTSGIVGNANANLGRPPRPPGFKKRPNTAGAQPMGGLPIEEFLAVMNGGGDSGDLVGKLMQLGISLASNAG